MAQGDVLLNSDGTIALDATGKVRLVDVNSDCPDCCGCTASGTSSVRCDDITPSQYTITFSGITSCGCINYASGAYVNYSLSEVVNAPFVVDYKGPGSPNTWSKTITNWGTFTRYSGSGCTTSTHTATVDGTIRLEVISDGGGNFDWSIGIEFTSVNLGFVSDYWLFYGTVDQTVDGATKICETVPSISNSFLSGACGNLINPGSSPGNDYQSAYGGTATVVCV